MHFNNPLCFKKLACAATGLVSIYCVNNSTDNKDLKLTKFNFIDNSAAAAPKPNEQSKQVQAAEKLKAAIAHCKSFCWGRMNEAGTPGLVVAVSVDGKVVWKHGFGYADVENKILASPSSVMRIASISKSLTMVAAARLIEDGKLDLDKPVRDYVPAWPEKHLPITTRQLASHTSGIRHYKEETTKEEEEEEEKVKDTKFKEFYSMDNYTSVTDSLEMFKNDDLLFKPGERFHYTTHGFTLLSSVVEAVAGEPFDKHMRRTFREMGLNNTHLDKHEPLIYNRARFYKRDEEDHVLKNAPYVDNSYKWAGGGFLSTVGDLVKFGNAMLYSSQSSLARGGKPVQNVVYHPGPFSAINTKEEGKKKLLLPGFLSQDTVTNLLWKPVTKTQKEDSLNQDASYGLGWAVMPAREEFAFCRHGRYYTAHTGGAMGASSVLLILPRNGQEEEKNGESPPPPQGTVVAIICNLQDVSLSQLALTVAKHFENVRPVEQAYRVQKVYQC